MDVMSIKVAGPAGSGVKSIGLLLQKTLQRLKFSTFGYTEYPSLIRGGNNMFQVDFACHQINSSNSKANILVCLDKPSMDLHKKDLSSNALIIYDPGEADEKVIEEIKAQSPGIIFLGVNIANVLKENNIPPIMENSMQLGLIMAVCKLDISALESTISWIFKAKSAEIIEQNKKAAHLGKDVGVEAMKSRPELDNFERLTQCQNSSNEADKNNLSSSDKMVLTANDACGLGFIAGGGKLYSAYPMTPSTNLLHYLAKHGPKKGIVVRQAATEIEAIGVAVGASYAGARAMVGTSGGGMDLMTEFLSMCGIAEVPLVLVNAQRSGPGTGLPTWQEQSDLNMAKNSGHGEFPRIVLAPGDPEEAYYMTVTALNFADKYQLPVIVLTDKHVCESFYTVNKFKQVEIDHGLTIVNEEMLAAILQKYKITDKKKGNFKRYADILASGVSPRTIPGVKGGVHLCSSDEHDEFGYSTESGEVRNVQQAKRLRKEEAILEELYSEKCPEAYQIYGKDTAELLVVGWGSTKGAILDAIKASPEIAFMQIKYLYPMNHQKLGEIMRKYQKIILVENNSTGQLKNDLILSGIVPDEVILKYDGKPFFADELHGIFSGMIK